MADQEPPSPPPADPVVLLHSDVLLIDELQEIIEEIVAQGPIEDQEPSLRYKAEVDEPVLCHCGEEIQYRAFATLLERKGSRLSAVRKEPLTFRCDDAAYYREALDGIDLRLPHPLVDAPGVNSLTIMISWPPHHDLRYHPLAGHNIHIVSCHDFFLVLRFGRHSSPWFYLVFNIYANSVALVPRLSTGCITTTSHCDIEAGVVIQQRNRCGDYILAELYLRRDGRTQLASNKATLCVWCSSRDSPIAGWWVQKEVVLPLPANEDQMPPTYSFRADMVFAVSTTSLCWVDLRTGILICDVIGALADGIIDNNDLRFRFIPLPEECTIKPDPLSGLGTQWGLLQAYRSMSSMHLGTIEFVCMDGLNIIESMLATWTLNLLDTTWRWEKCTAICIRDLVNDLPFWKNDRKLQQLTPSCPVISRLPGVTYLSVADLQCKNEQGCWELVGFYELCIDTLRQRILSVFEFPYVGCSVPHLNIFATDIGTYFNKHRRQTLDLRMEEEEEETRELMMVEETTELRMEEEEEETRELRMEVEESKSSLSKMGWRRYQRWRQERKLRMEKELTDEGKPKSSPSKMAESMSRPSFHSTKRIGVSPRRSEIPVGLQCVLDYPDN